ncbi:hypothetical protein [Dickeya ananatis]
MKAFLRWVLDILGQEVMTRRLPAKEQVAVLCPCCRKPASVIGTNNLTRYRFEIIVECDSSGCTNQKFKSEISFSYYIKQKRRQPDTRKNHLCAITTSETDINPNVIGSSLIPEGAKRGYSQFVCISIENLVAPVGFEPTTKRL